ncbi:hypothetical protein [Streptomyces sp. GbtcB6]|uniref:hypothetical protein n=1 Tax=Streptomyces sp. GbtcB6 TaxID=2824751 RepID=UPI0020C5EF72|nr:hypothetical protein [Streptomyces sp. GbtcB6]
MTGWPCRRETLPVARPRRLAGHTGPGAAAAINCRRMPKARQTVLDLARRLADPAFLAPTAALAVVTAALSVGVGVRWWGRRGVVP